MKKKIILGLAILLLTGCGSSALKNSYEKMQSSDKGINGYKMSLRVSSTTNAINDNLRITNYNDEEFEIINMNSTTREEREENEAEPTEPETTYVKDGKAYVREVLEGDELGGSYKEAGKNANYVDPTIYLKGLTNVASIEDKKTESLGEIEYTLYTVKFKKAIVTKIVKDTALTGIKVTENVDGKVYVDEKGYVYRVVYSLDKATITITYFKIDDMTKINFPNEIK